MKDIKADMNKFCKQNAKKSQKHGRKRYRATQLIRIEALRHVWLRKKSQELGLTMSKLLDEVIDDYKSMNPLVSKNARNISDFQARPP